MDKQSIEWWDNIMPRTPISVLVFAVVLLIVWLWYLMNMLGYSNSLIFSETILIIWLGLLVCIFLLGGSIGLWERLKIQYGYYKEREIGMVKRKIKKSFLAAVVAAVLFYLSYLWGI